MRILAFDIGGTFIKYALCNDNFELTQYEEDNNYPKQYLVQDLLYFMKNRMGNI